MIWFPFLFLSLKYSHLFAADVKRRPTRRGKCVERGLEKSKNQIPTELLTMSSVTEIHRLKYTTKQSVEQQTFRTQKLYQNTVHTPVLNLHSVVHNGSTKYFISWKKIASKKPQIYISQNQTANTQRKYKRKKYRAIFVEEEKLYFSFSR